MSECTGVARDHSADRRRTPGCRRRGTRASRSHCRTRHPVLVGIVQLRRCPPGMVMSLGHTRCRRSASQCSSRWCTRTHRDSVLRVRSVARGRGSRHNARGYHRLRHIGGPRRTVGRHRFSPSRRWRPGARPEAEAPVRHSVHPRSSLICTPMTRYRIRPASPGRRTLRHAHRSAIRRRRYRGHHSPGAPAESTPTRPGPGRSGPAHQPPRGSSAARSER